LEKKLIKGKLTFFENIIFVSSLAFMCTLLLKQPDFGATVTLMLTTLTLFFITHHNIKQILLTFCCFFVGALALIVFRPYRLQRIIIFLDPWQDPKGAGFQIIQSLVAIGSGKWFGLGVGHSRQKFFYLPMQHTDFIFSIIAEETGFFGVIFLISLFFLLLYFGIKIAHQCNNYFSSLVIIAFATLISLQTIINMAVVTGLAPTKGIGLPFVSYGNTSLVCYLFMVGIIINIVYSKEN
jgi:cell division protein FtsW